MAEEPPPGYVPVEQREAAWAEGKRLAQDALKGRKERIDNAASMIVPPPGEVPAEAKRQRLVGFDAAASGTAGGNTPGGASPKLGSTSKAAAQVSQRQEAKRSRVFKELRNLRSEQAYFITYKLMNNGALRQLLEHIFRVACSHGSDLEDALMSRRNFKIFMEEFGVTTATPYDQFEPRSVLTIREKVGKDFVATETQLLRFGTENVDHLFEYGLDHIGKIVVDVLGASPDFDEVALVGAQQTALRAQAGDATRLDFFAFLICMVECVHRMIPPDYYPPLSNTDVHMFILETFFFLLFGNAYLSKQIPAGFDDFGMVETMAETIGRAYATLADVFLYCIAPTKYEEWTDQERHERYIRIACGDASIEYEALMEVVKRLKLPLNLISSEPTYELFCRYDCGGKRDRAVIDFQGFTLMWAHIAFTVFLTNAAYPTPQSKFQRLMEAYIEPMFPPRITIPPPSSATKMIQFDSIKPERATTGTELWVFGQDFPIRATQNGYRAPLFVRFNDIIAKGSCMSSTVGNVVVPRLPTTEDTVTQVSLADGEEPGTYVVKLEAKTVAVVSISNDRLRWSKSQSIRLSFEDVLATYNIPNELVQKLKALFSAFGEKGPDYELNGEILPGPTYMSVVNWSKICQRLPMCCYDDGDPQFFVSRHTKFFENAKPRSDAIDVTVPVLTFPDMVNLIFKLFIAQYGPDERLIDTVRDALQNAQQVIDQWLAEKKPKARKSAMGVASLVEYQKVLSQVAINAMGEGRCVNCGQDPLSKVTDNVFLDLDMINRVAVKKRPGDPLDVVFSKAITAFTEKLPKDQTSEELTEFDFAVMSVEDADQLAERGKFYFLNSVTHRIMEQHEEDFSALETRFMRSVEKARLHGRYMTMQAMLLQQTMESISDGISRINAIVIEHENLILEERRARMSGLVSQSDTYYAMATQLYQGLKATINTVKDMTRPYLSDDDVDKFDPKFMFEEANTFKQTLIQQSLQLDAAIKLRLSEIRHGPQITAEGLVRAKYLTDAPDENDAAEDDDDDPAKAVLRRQASQAGADLIKRQSSLGRTSGGVSEEEVQKRIAQQVEMIEAAYDVKVAEAEKKKEAIIRECFLLLEGLMRHTQEAVDIPSSLANPCFKFLHDRGSQLRRFLREGGDENSTSQAYRPFVMTEDACVQSDEDQYPSILSMQQELMARGITNGVKLAMTAVLMRKALNCGRDVLGKYASNVSVFSDLSKILKLEMQNVMNARTRELVVLPQSESEMYTRDSVTNTGLTLSDFHYVEKYVKHQMVLEDLVALTNVAKEEAAAAASKMQRRGPSQLRKVDSKAKIPLDIPISPTTAALAAKPLEMMGLISPDSVLSLEARVEKRLLEKNAKYIAAIRAPLEGRCKDAQTAPPPSKADASDQTDFVIAVVNPGGEGGATEPEPEDGDGKKKSKKKGKEKERERSDRTPTTTTATREKATPPAQAAASTPRKPTKSNTPTPPSKAQPRGSTNDKTMPPSVKKVLPLQQQQRGATTVEDEAVVVDDAVMDEALAEADDYAEQPTLASALEYQAPAASTSREKPSKLTDLKTRLANAGDGKGKKPRDSLDLPGPSMQAGTKITPRSQVGTTEELMKKRWSLVAGDADADDKDRNAAADSGEGTAHHGGAKGTSRSPVADAASHDDDRLASNDSNNSGSGSSDDSDSSDDSSNESDGGDDMDRPSTSVRIAYVEEDFIPDINLLTEAKKLREAQTREIEASTARLAAVIENAMKNAPDAAAVHIELQGMNELVRQLRLRVSDLQAEVDAKADENVALRTTIGDLKRYAIQGLDGKHVVLREARGTAAVPLTQQQVDAARQILSEKGAVRHRIGRLIKKYALSSTSDVVRAFEESAGNSVSSGLSELTELLERLLHHADKLGAPRLYAAGPDSPSNNPSGPSSPTGVRSSSPRDGDEAASLTFPPPPNVAAPSSPPPPPGASSAAAGAATPVSKKEGRRATRYAQQQAQSLFEDCLAMLRIHFSDTAHVGGGQMQNIVETDPSAALPMLARNLLTRWQNGNLAAMAAGLGPAGARPGALEYFATLVPLSYRGLADPEIATTVETVRSLCEATAAERDRIVFMMDTYLKAEDEQLRMTTLLPRTGTVSTSKGEAGTPPLWLSSPLPTGLVPHVTPVGDIAATQTLISNTVQSHTATAKSDGGDPTRRGSLPTANFSSGYVSTTSGFSQRSVVPPNRGGNEAPPCGNVANPSAVTPRVSRAQTADAEAQVCVQVRPLLDSRDCETQTVDVSPPRSPTPGSDDNSLFRDRTTTGAADTVGESAAGGGEGDEEEEFDYAAYMSSAVASATSNPQRLLTAEAPLLQEITATPKSFADAEVQTAVPKSRKWEPLSSQPHHKLSDKETQSDEVSQCAFIVAQSWNDQMHHLFTSTMDSISTARVHPHPVHQWLLGAYHCLRSNMLPNLEQVARQYATLQQAARRAKDEINDLPCAMYDMLIKGIDTLNEACGGPLTMFIASHYEDFHTLEKADFSEVNVLISNLMAHIDHRVGGDASNLRANHGANSQRSINRWRTHIILTFLEGIEADLQLSFPRHQREAMLRLVEYDSLTNVQQRRLFLLQGSALSLLIFSHCSRKNFVPLALAARVQAPLPLSLQATSTSYVRMVRDCLLAKIVPDRFNDIGMKPMVALSHVTKQFVAMVLGFNREELAWLNAIPEENRTRGESVRLQELTELCEKLRTWNPVADELSVVDWLDVLRATLLLLLGPQGRLVPKSFTEVVARAVKVSPSAAPPLLPSLAEQQAKSGSGAFERAAEVTARQPSSLDQPPQFLKDVQWATPTPAARLQSRFVADAVHHLKCETPPPMATCTSPVPVSLSAKTTFTPGKISVSRSASLGGGGGGVPSPVVAAHGGSTLGHNTTSSFSASSNAGSTVASLFHAHSVAAIRPLSLGEQKELHDLRELCGSNSHLGVPPLRSYRAWLELELRQRVGELRATDLDGTPALEVVQAAVQRALAGVDRSLASCTNVVAAVSQLTGPQMRLFVQLLRGEQLRGARIPPIAN